MYLFELKNPPIRAGKAVLEWNYAQRDPVRDRNNIFLPYKLEDQYFSLNNGEQFLIKNYGRMWFGGTDEEPFLVEMDKILFDNFIQSNGSEKNFYDALVPENIMKISEETKTPYKRQGDIFAARFCGEKYLEKNLAKIVKLSVKEGEQNILGTRHLGRGTGIWVIGERNTALFRGKIEAPDHKPLNLEDAFYLLGQTKHIINPTKAD